jgi:hypothetical protein
MMASDASAPAFSSAATTMSGSGLELSASLEDVASSSRSSMRAARRSAFISSFCADVATTSEYPPSRIRSSSSRAFGKGFSAGR